MNGKWPKKENRNEAKSAQRAKTVRLLIKNVPFLMRRADPLKSCGIFVRGSERGSVFNRAALKTRDFAVHAAKID